MTEIGCMAGRTPAEFARRILETHRAGGTTFLAGCGGFHAHACHMAAELVVRYRKNREPIRAVALGCNPAIVSAAVNDVGPDMLFAREFQALHRYGDLLVVYSTSGRSGSLLWLQRYDPTAWFRIESQEDALRFDHLACEALEEML